MLEVNKAEYVGNYVLNLEFNNGKVGMVNLEETIFKDKRQVFSRLKMLSNFKNFNVEHSTVIWSDGLDLASEYLFYLTFKDEPELQKQFKEWGYIT